MLADKDPRLAVRGWVCAAYDVLPTDPHFMNLSDEQLHWLQHSKRNFFKELFDNVGIMLGTSMTSDRLYGSGSKAKKTYVDKASIPLAHLLSERFYNIYKSTLSKPRDGRNGDLMDIPASDWKRLLENKVHEESRETLQELKNLQRGE